jgi:CTP:molybdopterin cytidylyltransferase MocA
MKRRAGAVILAAGAGRRMGGIAKALLPLGDGTFLSALAEALRGGGVGGMILVVTGAHRASVARAARGLGLRPVHNPRHSEGQLSSARTGLAAAVRLRMPVALLLPCDLPELRAATVSRLLAVRPPAVPVRRGRSGHPLALDRASMVRLLAVRGAESLRDAIRSSGLHLKRVAVQDPAIHQNLNTVGAYRGAYRRAVKRSATQAKSRSRRPATSS